MFASLSSVTNAFIALLDTIAIRLASALVRLRWR